MYSSANEFMKASNYQAQHLPIIQLFLNSERNKMKHDSSLDLVSAFEKWQNATM